jgi:flagellar basal-body rod protein FlgB
MALLESDALVQLLNASGRNHQAIANNLANVDTPGYRTMRVRFAEELGRVLDERGQCRRGENIDTELYRPLFSGAGPDGNDVSMERELVALSKNTLRTKLYLGVLGFRIRRLRAAITGK